MTTGKALTLPAIKPVPKHEVKVEGDDIYVALREAKVTGTRRQEVAEHAARRLLPLRSDTFPGAPRAPDTISCKVMQSFYREILLDHFEHPRNDASWRMPTSTNISIIPSVATW